MWRTSVASGRRCDLRRAEPPAPRRRRPQSRRRTVTPARRRSRRNAGAAIRAREPRLVPSRPAAVDDERRERRRLVEVERRLPADPGAAGVEPALVSEDPAAHVPDPGRGHLARERVELGEGQRGVPIALEHEVRRATSFRSCCPSPSTSVSMRNEGPSAVRAAYVVASFSFDAGLSATAGCGRRAVARSAGRGRSRPSRPGLTCRACSALARCAWNSLRDPACAAGTRKKATIATPLRRDGEARSFYFSSERPNVKLNGSAGSGRWAARPIPVVSPPSDNRGSCRCGTKLRSCSGSPEGGVGAPSLDAIESTLTDGYAEALALEAERTRIERRLGEVARDAGGEENLRGVRPARGVARGRRRRARGLRSLLSTLQARRAARAQLRRAGR